MIFATSFSIGSRKNSDWRPIPPANTTSSTSVTAEIVAIYSAMRSASISTTALANSSPALAALRISIVE